MPRSSLTLELLVRGFVLLSAAWGAAYALRRRAASVRATTWTAAMAALIVMPVLAALAPAFRITVPIAAASRPQVQVTSAPAPPIAIRPALESPASTTAAPRSTTPLASSSVDVRFEVSEFGWADAALTLWLSVAVALLMRTASSYRALRRNLARSPSAGPDAGWLNIVRAAARELRLTRPVGIHMTTAVGVPAVTGILKPTLLLPPDANDWPVDRRRAVALHELAHLARWDPLSQLVSQIACALYWCVPLVWLGARQAAILRERASDDVVLQHGVRPSSYAESLLDLVRDVKAGAVGQAALAMAARSRLRERVEAILDPVARRDRLSRRAAAAVAMTAAIGMTAIALVQPTPRQLLLPTLAAAEVPGPAINLVAPATPVQQTTRTTRQGQSTPPPAAPATSASEAVASPQQPAPRMCSGELNQSSSSIREDDSNRVWTIKLSGRDCTVDLRMEGRVQFTDDFSDIATINDGGFFRLDMTERGVQRHLELRGRNGSIERIYRIDGKDRPYDAEARTWFAAFLLELDRRTGVGVDVRLPHLLKQGGVTAVLRETALMTSDYARHVYYTKLASTQQLSAADIAQVLKQAATLTKSDHYASELIRAIGSRGLGDAGVREAITQMIDTMDSDHYRAESIRALLASGEVTSRELDFLVRMVPRMQSDHYRTETLRYVLERGRLDGAQLGRLAEAAKSIDSDHYAAEFVRAVVAEGQIDAASRQAFDAVMATIDSDHYLVEVMRALIQARPPTADDVASFLRQTKTVESAHYRAEALGALLGVPSLNARQLLDIVADARQIREDHYASEVLRRLVRHSAVNEEVRKAVLEAAAQLSPHYGDEVRRAAGR
jgi:beta-lactamase regulating signal transducer with metallopeptidase domain